MYFCLMKISKKYKSLYLYCILIFVVINIIAIFVVFKKYDSENSKLMMVSSTKNRYSKLREKIESLHDSASLISDSMKLSVLKKLETERIGLDSILLSDNFSEKNLELINQKIYDMSSQSNILENTIVQN